MLVSRYLIKYHSKCCWKVFLDKVNIQIFEQSQLSSLMWVGFIQSVGGLKREKD